MLVQWFFLKFLPLRALKTEKKLGRCQRELPSTCIVWQRLWIMKLLHDCTYYPLKQTKKTLSCFAWVTINSDSGRFWRFSGKFLKQTERLKRHSLFSWLETSSRKFGFHVFKPFLHVSFRLSRPFSVKRNWLREMVNVIIEQNQNSSVLNSCPNHLPKPWSDRFTPVNRRKASCPKVCDSASSHRYLPLGTFRQRAVRGGCIVEYASCIFNTLRGLVKCNFLVDRSSGRSLQQQTRCSSAPDNCWEK